MRINEPRITVITPYFNRQNYIMSAIKSVASQDYRNKRMFIIDNGSDDKGFEQIVSQISIYEKISVRKDEEPAQIIHGQIDNMQVGIAKFSKPNSIGFARNFGINHLLKDTDAFMFLDDDDEYLPGKISKSVLKWYMNPALVGVVYSDAIELDVVDGSERITYKTDYARDKLLVECILSSHSLISANAIKKCGVFDESLRVCEDYDLWLRVTEHFFALHIPEPLVKIRVGHQNCTKRFSKQAWEEDYRKIKEKVLQRSGHRQP